MNTFDKTLNEVIENYKLKVSKIHDVAQTGQATSRSEMNAFIGFNAQANLVSNVKFHIKKGLVTNGVEMADFLKRTKATILRDKREGSAALIALCDKLLTVVRPEMKWDKHNFVD